MNIILVRHGIAVEPDVWHGSDADRPLTEEGEDKTRQAAAGLRRLKLRPNRLLTSPLVRARQTAAILQEILDAPDSVQVSKALIPDAEPEALLGWLAGLPDDETVLCVGHEPNLSAVAGTLLLGAAVSGLRFKKAGACCLTSDGRVKPGETVLEWWMAPTQLRALGRR